MKRETDFCKNTTSFSEKDLFFLKCLPHKLLIKVFSMKVKKKKEEVGEKIILFITLCWMMHHE